MVLRRLPEAERGDDSQPKFTSPEIHEKLGIKGMPAIAASKIKYHALFIAGKIWRFMLEAKEMAPTGRAVLKVKRLFAARMRPLSQTLTEEAGAEETAGKTENDFLELIKKHPKDYGHYDSLGKFYLADSNFSDARDIYLYLTSHASSSSEYWARLGFSEFKLKNYEPAAAAYRKSVALDSGQPNRYYNLAQSLKALGKNTEALEAVNSALSMDPQNFKFLELKGRLEKIQ